MNTRVFTVLALLGAAPACGAKDAEPPGRVVRSDAAVASVTEDEPPRPRSEPPPRPPPPKGIKALRRDAIAIALSGDGRFLAAGDLAGQALLWDLQRERFLWADPTPEGNRLGRVVFAGQAPVYLIGAFHAPDRPWRLWSAEALERLSELGEPGWIGVDAAVDARGTRAVTLSSSLDGLTQRLELWDLAEARVLLALPIERASRGAVAMDDASRRIAVADDRGGVMVFEVGAEAGAPALPLFESRVTGGPQGDEARVSRVALSGRGDRLFGAAGARLMVWSIGAQGDVEGGTEAGGIEGGGIEGGGGEGGGARTVTLGVAPGAADGGTDALPIRGLHRVVNEGAERIIAVTRPVEGGLVFYDDSGAAAGHLDTGCRCETHALSADGKVAACGCVEASELRWGLVQGP